MTGRAIVTITTAALFFGACTTTTAHRLVLTGNLSREAAACEASCRSAATEGGNAMNPDKYAACLDGCPGTTSTSTTHCPPPDPSAICVETTKRNAGVAVGVVLVVVLVLVLLVTGIRNDLRFT
jgi:hypothetical protein